MLKSLNIRNIAVIEKADIEFEKGLNVLTGETGAGKSIIIDSINAILGERTSREIVRTGAPFARITAFFTDIPESVKHQIEDLGYECDEDNIIIQRDINPDGRGNVKINGVPATVSILKQIGRLLINIHGQHDSQALLSPEMHCSYLDRLGNLQDILLQYQNVYKNMCSIKNEINRITMDEEEKSRKIDLLSYQINELEQADIIEGEKEELIKRKSLIQNSENIISAVENTYAAINGGDDFDGIKSMLENAVSQTTSISNIYPEIADISSGLNDMVYQIEEYSDKLREIADNAEYNPMELEQIEDRLDLLYRLSKKYGSDEADMLEYLEKAKQELEQIELSDENRKKLQVQYDEIKIEAEKLAKELSGKRSQIGKEFAQKVQNELDFLDMPNVKIEISHQLTALGPDGMDKIEFLIATNAGEPPKPLAKIASGGELSRIMLSIKNILADNDDIGTMIFDEIDTGISGRAAQKVGIKLRQTAKGRQIICVTHSAQISAQANHHYFIEKHTLNGRTFTKVRKLTYEGRIREIARIISGDSITESVLKNAQEMIDSVKS